MKILLAQEFGIKTQSGTQTLKGPLVGIESLADLISAILSFLFPLAGILLFVYLVWGGFQFMLSQGNPEKVQAGKDIITHALMGFLLLIFSLFIVRLIALVFKLGGGFL